MSNHKRRVVVTKSEQVFERAGVALREGRGTRLRGGVGSCEYFPANLADAVLYSRREIFFCWSAKYSSCTFWRAQGLLRAARLYKGTSISVGPSPSNPDRSAFPNSSSELTRVPSTPIPLAKSVQARSGRPISNMSAVRGPGLPTPK
jgi:hypothetical protein